MPKFTGNQEWRIVPLPIADDAPLPGLIIRAVRGDQVIADGPSWRFDNEAAKADAIAQAEAIAARRNAEEARIAALLQHGG